MKITSVICSLAILALCTSGCKKDIVNNLAPNTVTDIDGNVYKTVEIGTQTWMAENLKVTKYRNGDLIQYITDSTAWGALTSGAYCWYNNAPDTYQATYGALYNWFAVTDSRNIAPVGWHVPTDSEWITLTNFLGGETLAGGKLKEAGTIHWQSPNAGATNETGFTALPGGHRTEYGPFGATILNRGHWWTSTPSNSSISYYRDMDYSDILVTRNLYYLRAGFSLRCLKD